MRKTPLTRKTPMPRGTPRATRPVPQFDPEVERAEVLERQRLRREAEKQARLAAMTPEARAAAEARRALVQERQRVKTERREEQVKVQAQKAWNRIRHATWERDDHRCVRCAVYLPMTDVAELDRPQCHHRKLRSRQGKDELGNLIMLCARCHDWCHKNVKAATKAGWIVPSSGDPAAWPVECKRRGRILIANDGTYRLAT